jgi:hypothetical protein
MSRKQFKKFFWPSLRKLILALIDEGIIASFFVKVAIIIGWNISVIFPRDG